MQMPCAMSLLISLSTCNVLLPFIPRDQRWSPWQGDVCVPAEGHLGRIQHSDSLQHGAPGLLSCPSHHKPAPTSPAKPNWVLWRCTGPTTHPAALSCAGRLAAGLVCRFEDIFPQFVLFIIFNRWFVGTVKTQKVVSSPLSECRGISWID